MQDGFLIIKGLVYKADGKTKAVQRPQALGMALTIPDQNKTVFNDKFLALSY